MNTYFRLFDGLLDYKRINQLEVLHDQ